jgi:hypothetical protein
MHGGNAKSHEDAAENEAKRRCAPATDDVKADAGYEDRHQERKGGQSGVVGHRYRHDEGEHADEVHRPYSASHRDRSRYQPDATRNSLGGPRVPAKVEGGVRREAGDQNGQSHEIRIVCSGNDHRDRPNFGSETAGDEAAGSPARAAGNVIGAHQRPDLADIPPHDLVCEDQDAPSAFSSQGRACTVRDGAAFRHVVGDADRADRRVPPCPRNQSHLGAVERATQRGGERCAGESRGRVRDYLGDETRTKVLVHWDKVTGAAVARSSADQKAAVPPQ